MVFSACAAGQSLIINEIDVDQIGTDTREFVELFNPTGVAVDFAVTPHVLVFFNGGDNTLPVIDGSYRAVELTGTIGPGEFLVVGSTVTPNVDIVLGGGGSNLIQNGPDAVGLYADAAAAWSMQRAPTTVNLVDAIAYGTGDAPDDALLAALGLAGQLDEWNDAGSIGSVFSIARSPDGGAFQTGATPTPGTTNDAQPPVIAEPGLTSMGRDVSQPVEVFLSARGGQGALRFRILSLPIHGTLFVVGQPVLGTGGTSLPLTVDGPLTYLPDAGFSGLDAFDFDAADSLDRFSDAATQELAVQAGGVVITEIMHTPGIIGAPQDQRVFEYVEVFNLTGSAISLTRLDTNFKRNVDTTDNLMTGPSAVVVPAGTMRIIAPGGLTADSNRQFLCEWGLTEDLVIRIPHDRWENMFDGSRLLLFGLNDVLLDAVWLDPPDFWTPTPGGSQSVKDSFLIFCTGVFDELGNDCVLVWPYSGPENRLGLRVSHSGIGLGSPGFVPSGLNEDFEPLGPCSPPPLGACCLPDGRCAALSADDCATRGGQREADFVPCSATSCFQPPDGACCVPTGACRTLNEAECANVGTFLGINQPCMTATCPATIAAAINEIEYDQVGLDQAEYVEILAAPGQVMIGWSLVFYNGDPAQLRPYRDVPLNLVVPDDGHFVVGAADVPNVDLVVFTSSGIQNGSPDGIALIDDQGVVVDAIAYGGSFRPVEGPAAGVLFADIGVTDDEPAGGDVTREITLQRLPEGDGLFAVTTDRGLGPDGTPGGPNADPLTAPYGACCRNDGLCLASLEAAACASIGGTYQGDATSCGAGCPILTGACCLPNGLCDERDETSCLGQSGRFAGLGTLCGSKPACPQPATGACCVAGGGCVIEDRFDCESVGGTYQGDTTVCDALGDSCGTFSGFLISEILRDNDGSDDMEFIEIAGPGLADLSGLTLLEIEGDFSLTGQQGRIDKVWSLAGFAMPADGFFLMADAAVAGADFSLGTANRIENGTASYLLVDAFDAAVFPQGTDVDIDNDGAIDAGLILGQILDAVSLADNGFVNAPNGDAVYAGPVVGPINGAAPAGVARKRLDAPAQTAEDFCLLSPLPAGGDGLAVATPGAVNNCTACVVRGDANDDGAIDLLDFAVEQSCFSGPVGPISPPVFAIGCRCLDLDADGDIDLNDHAVFMILGGFGSP